MNENPGRLEVRNTVTVGTYLATRLRQCGVTHLFGLPGDFNLLLLDEMLAGSELEWINSTNELNAAYAADGYARARGFGALVTTFGVGELSAVNGIAGSAAERVPVLQITGAPSTTVVAAGTLLHHTLVDGDFDRFERIYSELAGASAELSGDGAGARIDQVIVEMLSARRPGYLRIPTDAVRTLIDAAPLAEPLIPRRESDLSQLSRFADALAPVLAAADEPVLVLGHLADRFGLTARVRRLADSGGVRVATLLDAKGDLSEGHPASVGVYVGAFTPNPTTKRIVEDASLVVTVGVVLSDLLTGMNSHSLGRGSLVTLDPDRSIVAGRVFDGVMIEDALAVLIDRVKRGLDGPPKFGVHAARPLVGVASASPPDGSTPAPLTQETFWAAVEPWLPAGSPVFADAGTAFYGAAGITLPDGARLIGQPIWSSIGYTLPAAIGHGFAGPARPVLFIGDGAAQLSIQDLATVTMSDTPPIMFLINNDGYSVERAIRSPDAAYQNVTRWDWQSVVRGLVPDLHIEARQVRTDLDLESALAAVSNFSGFCFIEVFLDRDDVPQLLRAIADGLNVPLVHTP